MYWNCHKKRWLSLAHLSQKQANVPNFTINGRLFDLVNDYAANIDTRDIFSRGKIRNRAPAYATTQLT